MASFELHLTVENMSVDTFIRLCNHIGVKPIVLDLHLKNTDIIADMMTSSRVTGTYEDALNECGRIKTEFERHGFAVIRNKIETSPDYPSAPQNEGDVMPIGSYFESHIGVEYYMETLDLKVLKIIADEHGAHMSRNTFKILDGGAGVIMITLRDYNSCYKEFHIKMSSLFNEFRCYNFKPEPPITEFIVYDTKIDHDDQWIGK